MNLKHIIKDKIKQYIVYISMFLVWVVYTGCTKEITDDLFRSSFSITALYETEGYLEFAQPTTVTITETLQKDDTYSFSYRILEGTGYYELNGVKITEGTVVEMNRTVFTVEYIGNTTGINTSEITVSNEKNRTQTETLRYTIKDNDFTIALTPETTTLTIDLQGPNTATYTTQYSISIPETIVLRSNGTVLQSNTPIPTFPGANIWEFEPRSGGTVTLSVTTTSSFGASRTKTIVINSTNSPTLDTTPPQLTITGDTPTVITAGDSYTDAGATALDTVDGVVPVTTTSNTVVNTEIGTYEVTYNAKDASENTSTATRIVHVRPDYSITTTSSEDGATCYYPKPGSGIMPIQIEGAGVVPWVLACLTMDGILGTEWVIDGFAPLQFDLGYAQPFNQLEIAFSPKLREESISHNFDIEVSNDGITWTPVLTNIIPI